MPLKIIPTVIILGLLTTGVLGFIELSSVNHVEQHNCPASLVLGGNCPPAGGVLALVSHHISGVQNLTQSTINFGISLLLLSILFVFAFLIFSKLLREITTLRFIFHQKYRETVELTFRSKKKFLYWLSLHNKRDPYVLQRVHSKS